MDPLVEVRPNACLFVLGSQLTQSSSPTSTNLRYKSVVKSAIDYLQECSIQHDSHAIEDMMSSEPLRAMEVATTLLKNSGLYDKWLEQTFTGFEPEYAHIPDSVQWLIELQQMGAMLACTQYDTLLDKMARHRPAVISSKDHSFSDWLSCGLHHRKKTRSQDNTARSSSEREKGVVEISRNAASSKHTQRMCGFLHLHGANTSIESVHLHPYAEIKDVGKGACKDKPFSFIPDEILAGLRGVFHSKLVFLVGFDEGHQDPLLLSFLQLIYPEGDAKLLKNLPILLTSSPDASTFLQCEPAKVLELRIASGDRLRDIISAGEPRNFSVGMLLV